MKVMVMVKATSDSEAGVMPSEQLLTEMARWRCHCKQLSAQLVLGYWSLALAPPG